MVHQEDSDTLPPKLEQPALHHVPALRIVLTAAIDERGQVVEHQQLGAVQFVLDSSLVLGTGEVEGRSQRLAVHGEKVEVALVRRVVRGCCHEGENPFLHQLGRHFSVDVQQPSGLVRSPAEELATRCNRIREPHAHAGLADTSAGIEHRQAAHGQDRRQDVFTLWQVEAHECREGHRGEAYDVVRQPERARRVPVHRVRLLMLNVIRCGIKHSAALL
jgi:hypothetical protein